MRTQVADGSGTVPSPASSPPASPAGPPHTHFEVYPDQASITNHTSGIATSQVALPKDAGDQVYAADGYAATVTTLDEVSLANDNVFGDDDGASQPGPVTGSVNDGYAVSRPSASTLAPSRPAATEKWPSVYPVSYASSAMLVGPVLHET